jgi:hypothetical protein
LKVTARHGLDLSIHTNIRRANRSYVELTASELTQARLHWIKAVPVECFSHFKKKGCLPRESKITRFIPFLEDGLIRLGGRLQCADLSKALRHPLLLNGKHHFVRLLIWQTQYAFITWECGSFYSNSKKF